MTRGRPKKTGAQETTQETPNPLVNKTTSHQNLECVLTETEIISYARAMGQHLTKRKQAEDSMKSFSTQSKADISACDAEINRLSEKVNTGKEYRLVEVEVIKDLEAKEKRIIRKDTGATVRIDPLTDEECQINLLGIETATEDQGGQQAT